jgi:hypothetical protein
MAVTLRGSEKKTSIFKYVGNPPILQNRRLGNLWNRTFDYRRGAWARRNLPVNIMLYYGPYSALRRPARFHFQSRDDGRRSQSGTTVQNCAITLRGIVQKVSSGAIYRDSQAHSTNVGRTTYRGLPGEYSKWNFDYEPLGPGPHFCVRVLESCDGGKWPIVIYYLVLIEDNSPRVLGLKAPGRRDG